MSLNDLALAFVVGVLVGLLLRGRVNAGGTPPDRPANLLDFPKVSTKDLEKYREKLGRTG